MEASPEVQPLLDLLRPCSGCAGGDLCFSETTVIDRKRLPAPLWRVTCNDCGRQTLSYTTPAAAAVDWNRRPIEDALRKSLIHRENIIMTIHEAVVGPSPGCP